MYTSLLFCIFMSYARAAVLSAPPASITQPPLLQQRKGLGPRADYGTFGWISSDKENGTVLWESLEYDTEYWFYTSSGNYYDPCYTSSECIIWTACSLGWIVAESTSSNCASNSMKCDYDLVMSSFSATTVMYQYWCAASTVNWQKIYLESPSFAVATPTETSSSTWSPSPTPTPTSTPATTSPAATSTPATTSPAVTTPTPSATQPPVSSGENKTARTGIIAGSVVGGLVVVGAIGVAVLFVLKRNRGYEPGSTAAPYQGDLPVWSQPEKPPESTVTPTMNDPHASAIYSSNRGSPPAASPAPMYASGGFSNELPEARSY